MEIPAEIKAIAMRRLSNKPPSSDVCTFSRLLAKHNKCLEQTKIIQEGQNFYLLMFRSVHLKLHKKHTQSRVRHTWPT